MMPSDGPSYREIVGVKWDVPAECADQCAHVIEHSFRSAPPNLLAAQLYRLRMMTRARQASAGDQEAEAAIWLESLQCWPGDVALHVLATWTSRPNGQFWPTWNEVETELRRFTQPRKALAHCVLRGRETANATQDQEKPDPEARKRAVAYWEEVVRPMMTAHAETSPPRSGPPAGLDEKEQKAWWAARLETFKGQPVPALSAAALKTLGLGAYDREPTAEEAA